MDRASWITGASAASFALATTATARSQGLRQATMASLGPTALSWPFMICDELGLYKHYGLDIQSITITSTAGGAQLLIAKGCDFVDLSVTQVIEAGLGGADVKMYANTVSTPPYSLVAQKDCKKASDLRGKTIVVGGVNDFTRIFAERIMEAGGVKSDEYSETYAGATTDRYAALYSGSAAAAIVFPPWDFRATDEGYNVIGTVPGTMQPFPYDGLSARGSYAEENPEIMVAMLEAYSRSIRWLYNPLNKAHAIEILSSQTRTASGDATRTYDELITKFKSFSPNSQLSTKGVGVVIDMLAELDVLRPPLPSGSRFFDDRFIDQADVQVAREGG